MKPILLTLTAGTLLACLPACKSTGQADPPPAAGTAQLHPGADAATHDLAEREMIRRQQALEEAFGLIEEGDRRRAAGDLEGATRTYQESLEKLP